MVDHSQDDLKMCNKMPANFAVSGQKVFNYETWCKQTESSSKSK